jgi:hypothetical protein
VKLSKKVLSMALSTALVASTLAGCGGSDDVTTSPSPSDNSNAEATEGAAEGDESGEVASTEGKQTYDDLGGMTVKIGDWYSSDEEDTSSTQYAEDTAAYRQQIYDKYNFTVERNNLCAWVDMPEKFTNEVMTGNPSVDIWYLYQDTVNQPLKNNLFYDLSKVKTVDFSEEKWNKQVKDLMTYKGGIYGMSTELEPRAGIFYNKRIFEEAGIDPEEPYDLQAKGEWTWAKFEEYCAKLTQDVDNDGVTDIYAMASFSKDYLKLCAASNGAQFVSRDENGKYVNATTSQNFLDAANWGVSLIQKGYIEPDPEGASWDWFITAFRDGECAMQTAEVYTVSSFANSMDDKFGFVMFPAGPNGNMATVPFDNVLVVPSCFDDEYVNKVMFAYDLYTETTPGYTTDDTWKSTYYGQFSDTRAVDETLTMMRDDKYRILDYQSMITDTDYGDFTYSVYALAKTPSEQLEEMTPVWDKKIADANS